MTSALPNFRRIEVAPAYQKVADAIEREIVNGRIKPNDPIGTESELVQQFGVNRSTVREGIRVLEESGLIRRDSSRRLYACLPRYNKLATRLSRAMVLHEVTFRELYETAMVLEIAAIEYAVDHATDDDIAGIAANIARTEQAVDNPRAFSELDAEFHVLIARASHNRVLQLAREPAGLWFFRPRDGGAGGGRRHAAADRGASSSARRHPPARPQGRHGVDAPSRRGLAARLRARRQLARPAGGAHVHGARLDRAAALSAR